MPRGVYERTKETRRSLSKGQKGKKHSEEHCRNISKGLKERYKNNPMTKETKGKISDGNKGKLLGRKQTEEHKKNSSRGLIEYYKNNPVSEERKRNISKGQTGKISWSRGLTKETDERVKRIAESHKGDNLSEEARKNYSRAFKGRKTWNTGLTKETDERMAKMASNKSRLLKLSNSIKKLWEDPEYRKKLAKVLDIKPNKPERIFDELTPECIRYVGDYQFIIITNKQTHNPDFKVKGQKKIIELFGDYWHEGEDPKKLIKEYAEVGFDCIIFWEHEIYEDTERVLKETLKFIEF